MAKRKLLSDIELFNQLYPMSEMAKAELTPEQVEAVMNVLTSLFKVIETNFTNDTQVRYLSCLMLAGVLVGDLMEEKVSGKK